MASERVRMMFTEQHMESTWGSIRRAIPLVIMLAGIAAYANSFSGVFLFDDIGGIVRDVNLRHFASSMPHSTRPLVRLTLYLNYTFGKLNAADYHAVNLLIHIAAGLLLFGIVRRTISFIEPLENVGIAVKAALGGIASTIWLVHPLQTESVTYIIQRAESLMGLFYFLALYLFIVGVDSPKPQRWHMGCIVAASLGMATKPIMITLPIMVLLFDRFFVAKSFLNALTVRLRLYTGLAFTWIIPVALSSFESAHSIGQSFGLPSPIQYFLSQQAVVVHYLQLALWPQSLCLDYGWAPVSAASEFVVPLLINTVLFLLTLWASYRRHPAGFCGLWFFITLAPTSSVIPISDLAVEHRMYVPLAALVVFVVFSGYSLLAKRVRPQLLLFPALLVVAVLAFLTHQRNEDYRSEQVMWRDVIGKRPDNYRAHIAAVSVMLDGDRPVEAERVATALLDRMNKVMAEAPAARNAPLAHNAAFWYPEAQNQLGRTLIARGKVPEAIVQFQEATRKQPDNAVARYNLAWALYLSGRKDEAEQAVCKALSLRPDYGRAHMLMGLILTERGRFRDAMTQYERIANTDPDASAAKCEMAWLLATCTDDSLRDGKRAIGLAEEVCRVTGYRSIHALDALAAAYAEAGRFPDAVGAAKRALEQLRQVRAMPGQGDNHLVGDSIQSQEQILQQAAGIESRIHLYESGLPFRGKTPSSGQDEPKEGGRN